MSASLIQSLSKNFISLKRGLEKSYLKANSLYKGLNKNALCKESIDISKIIRQLKVLTRIIRSILKIIQKLFKFTKFLQKIIIALSILVKILKFLPLPARFVTTGITTTFSDLVAKITDKVNAALRFISGVNFVLIFIQASLNILLTQINVLIALLENLSQNIKLCLPDLSRDLDESLVDLKLSISDLNSQMGDLGKTSDQYKGFTFEIIEEETVDKVIAKRRYAVAINSNGIVELTGTPTFGTDKQTLIDELKLRIDSENLVGYPFDQSEPTETQIEEQELSAIETEITEIGESIIDENAQSNTDLNNFINNNKEEKKLKKKFKFLKK